MRIIIATVTMPARTSLSTVGGRLAPRHALVRRVVVGGVRLRCRSIRGRRCLEMPQRLAATRPVTSLQLAQEKTGSNNNLLTS